jgi:NADH-quinone oxidoreductase subunit C
MAQQLVPARDATASASGVEPVRSLGVKHGVLVLELETSALLPIVTRLQTEFGFDLFLDVTAVDWPDAPLRFEVVHHFYSTLHKVRIRLKQRVSEAEPVVDTLTGLYGSAGYMERECHDMYGIRFRGNDDLRPILLYEGFVGHPLRKDYPKQLEQPLVPYRPPQGTLVR